MTILCLNLNVLEPFTEKEKLDFAKPKYKIERIDSDNIKQKILNISYVDWKKMPSRINRLLLMLT
jgi:hypothetical protein